VLCDFLGLISPSTLLTPFSVLRQHALLRVPNRTGTNLPFLFSALLLLSSTSLSLWLIVEFVGGGSRHILLPNVVLGALRDSD